jgi:hypothetical protein
LSVRSEFHDAPTNSGIDICSLEPFSIVSLVAGMIGMAENSVAILTNDSRSLFVEVRKIGDALLAINLSRSGLETRRSPASNSTPLEYAAVEGASSCVDKTGTTRSPYIFKASSCVGDVKTFRAPASRTETISSVDPTCVTSTYASIDTCLCKNCRSVSTVEVVAAKWTHPR